MKKKLSTKDKYKIARFTIIYASVLIVCMIGPKVDTEIGGPVLGIGLIAFIVTYIMEKYDRDEKEKRELVYHPDHIVGWDIYDMEKQTMACPKCGYEMKAYYVFNKEKEIGETHMRCKACKYDVDTGRTWRFYYSMYEMRKIYHYSSDVYYPRVSKVVPENEDPYDQPYRKVTDPCFPR